jgi:hypothetical protein
MSAGVIGLIAGALFGAWLLVVGVCRVKRENDQMLSYYAELLEKAAEALRTGSTGGELSEVDHAPAAGIPLERLRSD